MTSVGADPGPAGSRSTRHLADFFRLMKHYFILTGQPGSASLVKRQKKKERQESSCRSFYEWISSAK
jgi:hypothetical protein